MRFQLSYAAVLAVAVAAIGCAPTNVQTDFERSAATGRPERILVYEFAFSPDQVQLDRGLGARVQQAMQGTPPSVEERELGRSVARVIADQLVAQINAMGLPAERAYGAPSNWMHSVLVEGQLLSVDQGNRTQRLVIGLGAGHSDVESEVQVYATSERGLEKLAEFSANARSGYKPGAAETMGAGAAAGAVGTAAAMTAGTSVLSETLSADVQADAKRTADAVAAHLQEYFSQQGWIAPQ
jgi:hypothetical protein